MQTLAENLITQLIANLRQTLPPTFTRQYVVKQLGGLVSVGGLANIESEKKEKGPCGVRCGKYIIYEKETFLKWLEDRIRLYNRLNS